MLKFRKVLEDVMVIDKNGDALFSGALQETSLTSTPPGELQITQFADPKLGMIASVVNHDVKLKGKVFTQAMFPLIGLQIRNPANQVVAELDSAGNLYLKGLVNLSNPADSGPFTYSSIIYAAPGLDYSTIPGLSQYTGYQNPTPSYTTRTIDISDFADLGNSGAWPFTNEAVPINGHLRVPNGNGPFPLALFAHGNHWPLEHSTPGYIYLCELLASHGIIAGTIDVNFLNGANFGENDARAIVHLEHVKQFKLWHQQPGHPLQGRVDLARIMIAGHSRGGEAVGHASLFNKLAQSPDPGDPPVPFDGSQGLGPYNFSLRSVVAVAPTDNQYTPTPGPTTVEENYFIVHGSRDNDVSNFVGYRTYDRAHPIDLSQPTQFANGLKGLLWIYGANHNFFNSVWQQESSNTITRSEQENIAKVYISAIARGILREESLYLDLLKDYQLGVKKGWLPATTTFVSQYQDAERLFIQHFEEDNIITTVSPPVSGSVDTSNIQAQELFFNLGSAHHLFQETHGLCLNWTTSGEKYTININPGGLPTASFRFFALRVGQSFEPNNLPGQSQDFTIKITDGLNSFSINVATLASLPYPATPTGGDPRTVMQTIRIPLKLLQTGGIDINNIREITFLFDRPINGTGTVQGSLYIDEIQLTN